MKLISKHMIKGSRACIFRLFISSCLSFPRYTWIAYCAKKHITGKIHVQFQVRRARPCNKAICLDIMFCMRQFLFLSFFFYKWHCTFVTVRGAGRQRHSEDHTPGSRYPFRPPLPSRHTWRVPAWKQHVRDFLKFLHESSPWANSAESQTVFLLRHRANTFLWGAGRSPQVFVSSAGKLVIGGCQWTLVRQPPRVILDGGRLSYQDGWVWLEFNVLVFESCVLW